MTTYQAGHVRHNTDTKEVAVRTMFSDDPSNPQMARLAWLVATVTMGARNATTDEVQGAGWTDLWVPSATPGEGEPDQ